MSKERFVLRVSNNIPAIVLLISSIVISGCSSGKDLSPRQGLTEPDDRRAIARTDYRSSDYRPPDYRPSYNERRGPIPNNGVAERKGTEYRSRQQGAGCAAEPVAARPQSGVATVARGDNLCRIATRYQITVQSIVDENRLSGPTVVVGQRLKLPSPEFYSDTSFGRLRRR